MHYSEQLFNNIYIPIKCIEPLNVHGAHKASFCFNVIDKNEKENKAGLDPNFLCRIGLPELFGHVCCQSRLVTDILSGIYTQQGLDFKDCILAY